MFAPLIPPHNLIRIYRQHYPRLQQIPIFGRHLKPSISKGEGSIQCRLVMQREGGDNQIYTRQCQPHFCVQNLYQTRNLISTRASYRTGRGVL